MRFTHRNNGYEVTWQHDMEGRVTYCTVFDLQTCLAVAVGRARCHPADHYCKGTGRRLSLAAALSVPPFTRDTRKQVWATYFATHRDGWELGLRLQPHLGRPALGPGAAQGATGQAGG